MVFTLEGGGGPSLPLLEIFTDCTLISRSADVLFKSYEILSDLLPPPLGVSRRKLSEISPPPFGLIPRLSDPYLFPYPEALHIFLPPAGFTELKEPSFCPSLVPPSLFARVFYVPLLLHIFALRPVSYLLWPFSQPESSGVVGVRALASRSMSPPSPSRRAGEPWACQVRPRLFNGLVFSLKTSFDLRPRTPPDRSFFI